MAHQLRWVSITASLLVLAGCQARKPPPAPAEQKAVPAAQMQRGLTLTDLVKGELGIGGGFLIGADPKKIADQDHTASVAASHQAEESPVQIERVHESRTADLNNDGFLTLDEMMAMVRAGLNDDEVLERVRKTGFVIHITPEQQRYLTDRGVSQKVVEGLLAMSKNERISENPFAQN